MNLQAHDEETIELAVRLRQMAVGSADEQAAVKKLCKDDPVAFLMAGGWTKVVKEVTVDGTERPSHTTSQPFIPWRSQRQILRDVADCVQNGQDIAWAKSREMGASWLLLSLSLWGFLYHEWSVLLCSRTEDLVDRAGDLDSLFPRIDSIQPHAG